MPYLNEVVGVAGAYETMRFLADSSETSLERAELATRMDGFGVSDPEQRIETFVSAGILQGDGQQVRLTGLGLRSSMLLEALNGGDLRKLYRRLGMIDSGLRAYELVREKMTQVFLRSLMERPSFGRLYLCSPWINLGRREQEMLAHAVFAAGEGPTTPEILVLTRPGTNGDGVPASVAPLQALGATVYLHSRLHTKLYIREPDANGGYAMAIVGSENLTRGQYLELGIRVNNDGQVINQLVSYFWDVANWSSEA